MLLPLKNAEAYVKKTPNARWEGWTIIVHRPNAGAEYDRKGRFSRDSQKWGYEKRITPNAKGMYYIPQR